MDDFESQLLELWLVEIVEPVEFLHAYDVSIAACDLFDDSRASEAEVQYCSCSMRELVQRGQSVRQQVIAHHVQHLVWTHICDTLFTQASCYPEVSLNYGILLWI